MKFGSWLQESELDAVRRLANALDDNAASDIDLAVLIRGALRAESLSRGYKWEVDLSEDLAKKIEPFQQAVGIQFKKASTVRVSVEAWQPKWLQDSNLVEVDSPCLPSQRRPEEKCAGDPFLTALNLQDYTSTAQRDAVRSVFCAKPGDTLAICLPTGSGKSLCAFLPAIKPMDNENAACGVSIIIVPTVALGLDLERRLRKSVGHPIAYRPAKIEEAEAIRQRCESGVQGPLIVSPEALSGRLLASLRKASQDGWLRYFVIDEAHMVLSWGDEFRPAFLTLVSLRKDLASRSPVGFVSILLSATFTDYHLRWLRAMFSEKERFHIVHAARLRPEPAYWMAQASSENERKEWIAEAIFKLPRPCIIYTTLVDLCDYWHLRLLQTGFKRIAKMHGGTSEEARNRLILAWNANQIDIIVATSAFGLGVDKQDVRAIIHAQLPETVDRFYQDVGRSGRDGMASISLLVTTPDDWGDVAGIGKPRFISAQYGLDRWKRMYQERKSLAGTPPTILVDLNAARELDMRGDHNRKWNVRTLQLLQRAGTIAIVSHSEEDYDHVAVQPHSVSHLDPQYWNSVVEPLRGELIADYKHAQQLLSRFLKSSSACYAKKFQECYASKTFKLDVIKACGGCPACRTDKQPPTCGRILARRIPDEPWLADAIGKELKRFMSNKPVALICYQPRMEQEKFQAKMLNLFTWLGNQGARNFVLPVAFRETLSKAQVKNPNLTYFLNEKPPRNLDATTLQPTAIAVSPPEQAWWKDFHTTLAERISPTILIAPNDLRCPDNPGRKLSDVVDGASMDLNEWENRFIA